MTFLAPIWLILCVPTGLLLYSRYRRFSATFLLRAAVFLALIFALSRPSLQLHSPRGTLVVVADRSRSMPEDSTGRVEEILETLERTQPSDYDLVALGFGEKVLLEAPGNQGVPLAPHQQLKGDGSRLFDALDQALSMVPEQSPGRILLLSDGRWTGRDPAQSSQRLASRKIVIDYRYWGRPLSNDLAIQDVEAPNSVNIGESFLITAWIRSPKQGWAELTLNRSSSTRASGRRQLRRGLNRVLFRDTATQAGTLSYTLMVDPGEEDAVAENNQAEFLVGVRGAKPLLLVSEDSNSGLADLLDKASLPLSLKNPAELSWALEELSGYSGVILEDVAADQLSRISMSNLVAWIEASGAGLLMTGGKNSFGPGGYFESPLDPVLPVSMELRNEHRKLAVAMVVALDRSGSMAASTTSGLSKMDLANRATVEVLDLLSPFDEFGVIAVDSSAHVVVELDTVQVNQKHRGRAGSVAPGGGGIFIYEALVAAVDQLMRAESGNRHVILFADAADSERPGDYKTLLEASAKANITVSVVGLGTPVDPDSKLLEEIASRGNGRVYFTADPQDLPRLFAQDTFIVARSTFIEETTPFQFTSGVFPLAGQLFSAPAQIGGYNLVYAKPGAELAAVTLDDYNAPVLAYWQFGTGRVIALTAQADGPFTGDLSSWSEGSRFFASLGRWVAGPEEDVAPGLFLTQDFRGDSNEVALHIDLEAGIEAVPEDVVASVIRSRPGEAPRIERHLLDWKDSDMLATTLVPDGTETLQVNVEINGRVHALPPVKPPYSPEFRPEEPGRGLETLARLARETGGLERLHLASIWEDFPSQERWFDLAPWLLLLSLPILLLEILERRTAWLSSLAPLRRPKPQPRSAEKVPPKTSSQPVIQRTTPDPEQQVGPEISEPEDRKPIPESGVVQAIRRKRRNG